MMPSLRTAWKIEWNVK